MQKDAAASVWIGFDPREAAAYAVARESVRANASCKLIVQGVVLSKLQEARALLPAYQYTPRPPLGRDIGSSYVAPSSRYPVSWFPPSPAPAGLSSWTAMFW